MELAAREVAEAFVDARRSGRALHLYPGVPPSDLREAYAIQDAALVLWDRPVGGWKVGRINAPDDERLGANRLVGPIFRDAIFDDSGSPRPMKVFDGGFAAAEAEFMLRISPPADAALPQTNQAAKAWIDEIRVGIEIASSPYPGINRDGPCVTVSDHGNNAGLVLGPPVDPSLWSDLDAVEVTLSIDGSVAGRATTATMLAGPFGAARFLLENLHCRQIEPREGWWISSGAITGVHEVEPGQLTTVDFGKLGRVSAKIDLL